MAENKAYDVIILGAGAAGLMCAARAGQRGRRVMVLDHAARIGEKIRISGGGRCNFTNLHCTPSAFLSNNPHFCKSALARYTPRDFIALVERHGIAWHEKTLGQLFCDGPSTQIITMLVREAAQAGGIIRDNTAVEGIERQGDVYSVKTSAGIFTAPRLVVATGGLSIPKIGATGLGYDIARRFGMPVIEPRPALVPLVFAEALLQMTKPLSGVAVPQARVMCGKAAFNEALLFTHRGLSGPAILQISSYWREGQTVHVDLCPGVKLAEALKQARTESPKKKLRTVLGAWLPERAASLFAALAGQEDAAMAALSDKKLAAAALPQNWEITPQGTEGYRTAEVTAGGVDTAALSSQTMEAREVAGLYFIGEVVDVTGWLGGYNFQWAWSSGWVCGDSV